jgi:ribonucleoside-diphosphate reductase alpha chain
LFETGHPWMTWKDPSNLRYPNQHEGIVHSSNLCVTGDAQIDCVINGTPTTCSMQELVDITNSDANVEVLSYNTETNTYEYKQVTAAALMNEEAEAITITDDESGKQITCTPEHKIFTQNRGYVEAQMLNESDKLVFS